MPPDNSMEKLEKFVSDHRITEVECLVPDMNGIARGKILPDEKFLKGLSEVDARPTGINRAKIHRDFLRAVGPMSLDLDAEAGPPVEAQAEVESVLPDEVTEVESVEELLGIDVATFRSPDTPGETYFRIQIFRKGIEALPVIMCWFAVLP